MLLKEYALTVVEHWKVPVNKALRTLPWYIAMPCSVALLMDLIALVFTGESDHRFYVWFAECGFSLWLLRQFFRFWWYAFRRFRTYSTRPT